MNQSVQQCGKTDTERAGREECIQGVCRWEEQGVCGHKGEEMWEGV